jgi:Flp pilus assembly pilin Flp
MTLLERLKHRLGQLHRDEQGADLIEYILIIAAIALPLLGVIIYFKNDLAEWISESYDEVKGDAETNPLE